MSRITRSFLFVAFTTALASSLSLIGGVGLEYISERILPLIPLIIAIPGLNDLVGDYASIIAAHAGDPKENDPAQKRALRKSIFTVLIVNIIAIIILSIATSLLRGYKIEPVFLLKFVAFVVGAAFITVSAMFAITQTLKFFLRKKRINPDELLVPVTTSIADIFMLLLVTLAVVLLF